MIAAWAFGSMVARLANSRKSSAAQQPNESRTFGHPKETYGYPPARLFQVDVPKGATLDPRRFAQRLFSSDNRQLLR
jgi:hypothetical protein